MADRTKTYMDETKYSKRDNPHSVNQRSLVKKVVATQQSGRQLCLQFACFITPQHNFTQVTRHLVKTTNNKQSKKTNHLVHKTIAELQENFSMDVLPTTTACSR